MALFGWLAPSQPAVLFSHTNSAPASSHQPVSSIFLSQQISTSHQLPASRTRPIFYNFRTDMYFKNENFYKVRTTERRGEEEKFCGTIGTFPIPRMPDRNERVYS
jgi:hypothetical protein